MSIINCCLTRFASDPVASFVNTSLNVLKPLAPCVTAIMLRNDPFKSAVAFCCVWVGCNVAKLAYNCFREDVITEKRKAIEQIRSECERRRQQIATQIAEAQERVVNDLAVNELNAPYLEQGLRREEAIIQEIFNTADPSINTAFPGSLNKDRDAHIRTLRNMGTDFQNWKIETTRRIFDGFSGQCEQTREEIEGLIARREFDRAANVLVRTQVQMKTIINFLQDHPPQVDTTTRENCLSLAERLLLFIHRKSIALRKARVA